MLKPQRGDTNGMASRPVMQADLSDPASIVLRGEQIYRDKYQAEMERDHPGKFIAIDVTTEKAFLGDSSAEAVQKALQESPHGPTHLMKIGARAAFRVGYTSNVGLDRIFR
jgi:hypothetical protein